jgi:NAD(P)-dependent dehydrogenase (short-subunit alcohol dehydrogenase family)
LTVHKAPRGGALITGASRRIGRVLALALAEKGFAVAVHARQADDDALSLIEAINAGGGQAALTVGDLASDPDLLSLVSRAGAAVGPLTLLVNNASLFGDDRIDTLTPRSFDDHIGVNLRAPVLLAQAFAAQAPDGGDASIVNMLDQRVLRPRPEPFSYSLAKGALWQATRMLAQALAPAVRVNGVGPGPTLASIYQSPEDFAAEAAHTLLQRQVTPEEVAQAVCYLIDARSVTGQIIAVDGGQHLGWRTPDVIAP